MSKLRLILLRLTEWTSVNTRIQSQLSLPLLQGPYYQYFRYLGYEFEVKNQIANNTLNRKEIKLF